MDNNKAFALYTLLIISLFASVITASVMAGVATLPTPIGFIEHVGLSLVTRAAYKSLDGPYPLLGFLTPSSETAERMSSRPNAHTKPGRRVDGPARMQAIPKASRTMEYTGIIRRVIMFSSDHRAARGATRMVRPIPRNRIPSTATATVIGPA